MCICGYCTAWVVHLELLVTRLFTKYRGALDYLLLQYFQNYQSGAAATLAKLLMFLESMALNARSLCSRGNDFEGLPWFCTAPLIERNGGKWFSRCYVGSTLYTSLMPLTE